MPDQREPRIRGTGHPLPFSKGRMATNLFLSGVEAEHAYELALDIELAGMIGQAFDLAREARRRGHVDEQIVDRAGTDNAEHFASVSVGER